MINQERKPPCLLCGGPSHDDHHLIHRSQAPEIKDEQWVKIRVCRKCHNIWHDGTAKQIRALRGFWEAVVLLEKISLTHYERFRTRMEKGGVKI